MSFELLHFRGSDAILRDLNMERDVLVTMETLDDALCGTYYKKELMRNALEETDWRRCEDLSILPGRRYSYKGIKRGVAIEGNFANYEYILEGLVRLQIGYDTGKIDMGILLLNGKRSGKSPLGSSSDMVKEEMTLLYPTISLPVMIALFDLGTPGMYLEEEKSPVAGQGNSEIEEEAHATGEQAAA